MPAPEQLLIALFSGAGFGFLIYLIGSSWQRLALILTLLWTMQTGPQYVFRWLDGQNVNDEVITVTILRVTFTVAACLFLGIAGRRHDR